MQKKQQKMKSKYIHFHNHHFCNPCELQLVFTFLTICAQTLMERISESVLNF